MKFKLCNFFEPKIIGVSQWKIRIPVNKKGTLLPLGYRSLYSDKTRHCARCGEITVIDKCTFCLNICLFRSQKKKIKTTRLLSAYESLVYLI